MAFVKEGQILDSFIVAEEIIHEWKKNKEGGLLVKLYAGKDGLWGEMENVDEGCITSPTLSVLVNSSPTRQFSIERELRQGDPLSPFLFNVVVEGLSNLLRKAHDLDMIRGISFGNSEVYLLELGLVLYLFGRV
ncbi:hypothetical protein Dsin_010340 [Dipteronia sinensis]|uniref:Reverse transcriptase domain-containing protein n=1 Tax=Dipteronia sinensis TaxID=43782 RepID=A0AAE0EEB3_9ROSI|nr:hypothetical protein Dsin_010340 [Dipteronia sinensis]